MIRIIGFFAVFAICQADDTELQHHTPHFPCKTDTDQRFTEIVNHGLKYVSQGVSEKAKSARQRGFAKAYEFVDANTHALPKDTPPDEAEEAYRSKCHQTFSYQTEKTEFNACIHFFDTWKEKCPLAQRSPRAPVAVSASLIASPLVDNDCNGFSLMAVGFAAFTSSVVTMVATNLLTKKGDSSTVALLEDEF